MTTTVRILEVLGIVLALIALDFLVGVLSNLSTFSIQKFPNQLVTFVLPYFTPLAVLGASVIVSPILNIAGATGGTAVAFYTMAAGVAAKALADISSKVGVSFAVKPGQTQALPHPPPAA